MAKKILIIAGEPSGDLHGGNLASALKTIAPDIELYGVGGGKMSGAGVQLYQDIKGLSCFGFFDAILHIKRFLNLQKKLLRIVQVRPPDLIILIDFSGFNLRFAKKINNKIPIFYYISPQVWASRPGRIQTIKKYIKKMLVIFDFERKLYQDSGVDVEFVGHPLLNIAEPTVSADEAKKEFKLNPESKIITLLPGSRKTVLNKHLPIMLQAASIINQKLGNCQFVIVKNPTLEQKIFAQQMSKHNLDIKIIEDRVYDCLNVADFVITSSGTATLETAIMGKPMLIMYKMPILAYLLYRPQIKVPFIGMVNIVAGKKIIEEFIQFNARPDLIAQHAIDILSSPTKISAIKQELQIIKSKLAPNNAAKRAASVILNSLS